MILNNISFNGITIDKDSISHSKALTMENMLSPLSKSLGEALDVKVTSNGDQLCLTISNKNDPKNVTTKILNKNSSSKQVFTELSALIIEKLSETTTALTSKVKQLQQKDDENQQTFNSIIHDLRSPMCAVSGFSELLSLNPHDCDNVKNSAQIIKQSTKKMNSMLEQLLQLTKIGSNRNKLEKLPFSVNELFSNTINSLSLSAQDKSITISRTIEKNLPDLNIDIQYFFRVMENLLSNAIKFSHKNTTINLSAKQEGTNIIITVKDEGQGIPEEDLSKLFIPFARISSKPTAGESSNGLGLASVKKIVEAHGGTIEANSKIGEGTEFKITLPIEQ